MVISQTGDGKPDSVNGCGGVNSTMYIPPTRFNVQLPGKGVGLRSGDTSRPEGHHHRHAAKQRQPLGQDAVLDRLLVRDQSDICLKPRAMCLGS